jgi:hypothetical protein
MQQNQTDPDVLKSGDATTLGTGIFAVPDPASEEFGAVRKEMVDDITYEDCVKRGHFVRAFKWVPRTAGQQDQTMLKNTCAIAGVRCVDRCAPANCLCVDGVCR